MYHQHPAARRPISFAAHSFSSKFLLDPWFYEDLDAVPGHHHNNTVVVPHQSYNIRYHKKSRTSLPSFGRNLYSSEASRDLAVEAEVAYQNKRYSDEYIKSFVPTTTERRSSLFEDSEENDMARLITLVLQPKTEHHRRESTYGSLLEAVQSDVNGSQVCLRSPPLSRKSSMKRRDSMVVAIPVNVPVEDKTVEWRQEMNGIKKHFARRQFKKCVESCKELLAVTESHSNTHPLYIIYLKFYAALSLEQNARSLSRSSHAKQSLFQEAVTYLREAKALIPSTSRTASNTILPRDSIRSTRKASITSTSTSSSARSSIESLFSQFSDGSSHSSSSHPDHAQDYHHSIHQQTTPFSPPRTLKRSPSIHSPRQSYRQHKINSSSTSTIMKPAPLRIKKVSFSSDTAILPSFFDGPITKPPSYPLPPIPTTAAKKSRFESTKATAEGGEIKEQRITVRKIEKDVEEWELINQFPMPPSPSRCPSLITDSDEEEMEEEEERYSLALLSSADAEKEKANMEERMMAIERFQMFLTAFGKQVEWHVRDVESQLAKTVDVAGVTAESSFGEMDAEGKKESLKERIKRRKENGWARKRFDPMRYRELCEKVLEEVDGGLVGE